MFRGLTKNVLFGEQLEQSTIMRLDQATSKWSRIGDLTQANAYHDGTTIESSLMGKSFLSSGVQAKFYSSKPIETF